MSSEPILICYCGSQSAEHSFHAAAALKGVRERLDGSVSHEVAGHARRPVLVVPPNESPLS
jgi:nucleotide-binding universal stress UspA family protein